MSKPAALVIGIVRHSPFSPFVVCRGWFARPSLGHVPLAPSCSCAKSLKQFYRQGFGFAPFLRRHCSHQIIDLDHFLVHCSKRFLTLSKTLVREIALNRSCINGYSLSRKRANSKQKVGRSDRATPEREGQSNFLLGKARGSQNVYSG